MEVLDCVNDIHENFVVVPIDKASSNVGIICKNFILKLNKRSSDIISNNFQFCERLELEIRQECKSFPFLSFSFHVVAFIRRILFTKIAIGFGQFKNSKNKRQQYYQHKEKSKRKFVI